MVTGVIVREPGLRRRARVMAHTIRVAVSSAVVCVARQLFLTQHTIVIVVT